MQTSVRVAVLLSVAFAMASASAEEPGKFQIKKLRLGMTFAEATGIQKGLKIDAARSDAAVELEVAILRDDSSPPTDLELTFSQGRLARILGHYSKAEMQKIGGSEILLAKMSERLGAPTRERRNTEPINNGYVILTGSWSMPAINRYFSFATESNQGVVSTYVLAVDTAATEGLKDRQKKAASTGF